MFDVWVLIGGFLVGFITSHYLQQSFYNEKIKILHSVQSELAILYQKLHNISDLIKLKGAK